MYEPQEDSFLLKDAITEFLKKNRCDSCLDIGTGTGIQGIAMSKYCNNVICSDVNPDALFYVKQQTQNNNKIKIIKSDLFEALTNEKFDLITFNPPYLPREDEEEDDLELTSGESGAEITEKFIDESKNFLNEKGKLLFVVSSLANTKKIHDALNKNFNYKVVCKKHFFFEDVMIYEAWLK